MIFYLYGDDTVRSRERRQQLMEKFKRDVDPSGLNLTRLDGSTVDAATLGQQLNATPFLARRRMVVVERLFENKDEAVLDTLEHVMKRESKEESRSSDDTIIVLWEDGSPTKALAKKLAKLPHAQAFAGLNEGEAIRWAITHAKHCGAELDARTAAALVERFPDNIWALATEVHKLSLYARSRTDNGTPTIDERDVDLLSSSFTETPIYLLSNDIEGGSLAAAAHHTRELLASGMSLFVLLSAVSKLFVNLLTAQRGALETLKLHPYVEKKMSTLSRRLEPNALQEAAASSLALEHKLKTTRIPGEVAFLRLLEKATRLVTNRAGS